jgi:hypothetical protein
MYTDLVIEKYEEFCQLFSSDENVKMLVEDYVEVVYNLYMNDNFEAYLCTSGNTDGISQTYREKGIRRDDSSVETIFKWFFNNSKNQFWRSITLDEFLNIYKRFLHMSEIFIDRGDCSNNFEYNLGEMLQNVVHFKVLRELRDLKKIVKMKEEKEKLIVPQINLIDL